MFATPTAVLGIWMRGILAIGLLLAGGWLAYRWYEELPRYAPSASRLDDAPSESAVRLSPAERIMAWRPGLDLTTAMLLGAVGLMGISLGGRMLLPRLLYPADPRGLPKLEGGRQQAVPRSDGSEIFVEIHGRDRGPTIILTHGWGMDHREWAYLKRAWGDQFRIVVWDLPGIEGSSRPPNRDFSLDRMAADLRDVIEATRSDGPVILVGHSIGGMVMLTFCRLFPEWLGSAVSRLVLIDTTYTNPLRTTSKRKLATALQKPLIEPLLHLQIWLSPLVWVMNWCSYLNGSSHWSAARSSFAGTQTRSQLDFVASFQPRHSPAVLSRGALGMLRYDASKILSQIRIPTLILCGDQDAVTLPEASEHIDREVPAASLHKLVPGKHCAHIEHDSAFAGRLAEFCKVKAASKSA